MKSKNFKTYNHPDLHLSEGLMKSLDRSYKEMKSKRPVKKHYCKICENEFKRLDLRKGVCSACNDRIETH